MGYAVGQKVYKYTTNPIGINQISSTIPDEFILFQNHPNPFNPVTKISFDLTQDARCETQDIKLVVYDALGKEVVTLINESLAAGSYEVEFDGNELSSAMYFYSLSSENNIATKKMLLMK